MPSDRDLRVARLMLRLQVGQDGDPLDNEILAAYESLPESSIIRNDWVRRRFLLGHLLEREGISALLGSIAALGGPAPAESKPQFVPTEAPVYDDAPAAQLKHAAPVAKPKAGSTKKRMQGLMPVLPVAAESAQQKPADSEASAPANANGEQP